MVGWKGWIVQTEGLGLSLGWGRALLFRCGNCDKSYYAVQTLFRAPLDQVSRLQEILYIPKFYESNTRVHYVYPKVSEPTVVKEPKILPKGASEFLKIPEYQIVAEFVNDFPFQHVAVLVGEDWKSVSEEYYENRECNRCYSNDLMRNASARQGNLYLRYCDLPRVYSEYQPRVTVDTVVYNHRFVDENGDPVRIVYRTYRHGVLGSLVAEKAVVVKSPDHNDVELGPGTWEFYHPRPSDGVD